MDQKNLIIAIVLSVTILLTFQFMFEQPRIERERAAGEAAQQAGQSIAPAPLAPGPGAGAPAIPIPGQPATAGAPRREAIIETTPRIRINSERLHGSVSIRGARIDDLTLATYRETLDPDSPPITLLSPSDSAEAYFADFGWWIAPDQGLAVAGKDTVWTANHTRLTPRNPVTLTWDNGQGLRFTQVISIDYDYMFTVTQRVANNTAKAVTLHPWGRISRNGAERSIGTDVPMGGAYIHEGPVGVLGGTLKEVDYEDLKEDGPAEIDSTGGWAGIKDQYWLVALIPDQSKLIRSSYRYAGSGEQGDKYQVGFVEQTGRVVPPGGSIEATSRLFAGAKEVQLLDRYSEELGIQDFNMAIDYTWIFFLTIPLHKVLLFFKGMIGNYGLAILLLTVLIKLLFFPLANKSYRAMSKMKKLQPQMQEIKVRFKDDKARQQQETMALFRQQGANPMAGCFPILLQIPVFISLYIVLFVTIEMRHAPFFGWIQDLSAPDPLTLLTLFGLVSWDVPELLQMVNIGIWPIIMGLTMFLQQRLNPQPADPVQAKIFMLMPIFFTFILGRFPAGLVIYWAWNNTLSIAQQWIIMRKMGVSASGKTIGGTAKGGGPPKGAAAKAAAAKGSAPPKGAAAKDGATRKGDAPPKGDSPAKGRRSKATAAGAGSNPGKRKGSASAGGRGKRKRKSRKAG